MEKFEIKSHNDKEIVLKRAADLERLYSSISGDEAIQVMWMDGREPKAKIIITASIAAKVKSGEITLSSEEGV